MNIQAMLSAKGLGPHNAVVIGSGILSATGIRASNDIDVVVDVATYHRLSTDQSLNVSETRGREILVDEIFEIGTNWGVLGTSYSFEDLCSESVLLDGVRYITLPFLLKVKKDWLIHDDVIRQKDIDDVKHIEAYLASHPA